MKPTEILSSEHRVIERVLDCLEAMVGQAKAAGRLEPQPAKDAVAFLRDFADRCHVSDGQPLLLGGHLPAAAAAMNP